jgi:hypothetical protein
MRPPEFITNKWGYKQINSKTTRHLAKQIRNKLSARKKNQNTSKTKKRKHGPSEWNSNSNNNNTVKHRKTHHN